MRQGNRCDWNLGRRVGNKEGNGFCRWEGEDRTMQEEAWLISECSLAIGKTDEVSGRVGINTAKLRRLVRSIANEWDKSIAIEGWRSGGWHGGWLDLLHAASHSRRRGVAMLEEELVVVVVVVCWKMNWFDRRLFVVRNRGCQLGAT